MTFQRVLRESGLTKVELAELYGVSRQTIHHWAAAGSPAGPALMARMSTVITQALESAIARRVLPLGAMDRESRRARVASMTKVLQDLKPAPVR